MRRLYSQFRILLFTLAFGLASVWVWRGFEIGSEYVHVDLPVARSDEVLTVFVFEHRWMPGGGGSGPHGPNVGLHLESEKNDVMTFGLGNYLDGPPIYLALGNDDLQNSSNSVPYFLECLTPGTSRGVVVPGNFHFSGRVRRLNHLQHLEFKVPDPKLEGRCWVSVPFFEDAATVTERFGSTSFDSIDWEDFDRQTKFYVSYPFFNK